MNTESKDAGLAVTRRETLFEDKEPTSRFHNAAFPSLVRCPDGSILLAHRVGREKNSEDGANWSEPCPIGIEGQFIDLLELPDGRIVLCYVTRTGRPAIRIRVAGSEPRSWSTSEEHFLYEQSLDDLAGAREASFGDYLQGMSRWSFGWPSMLLLDADTILVAYYSGRDSFSAIQLAEVRLQD